MEFGSSGSGLEDLGVDIKSSEQDGTGFSWLSIRSSDITYTVMNLRVPFNTETFLSSWRTVSVSGTSVFHWISVGLQLHLVQKFTNYILPRSFTVMTAARIPNKYSEQDTDTKLNELIFLYLHHANHFTVKTMHPCTFSSHLQNSMSVCLSVNTEQLGSHWMSISRNLSRKSTFH
jgi:hypothetical protein